MANPAADAKSALLSDDLKEYARTLDQKAFPKNFFCALCAQLAFDSWKLLCCNKSICSSCHATLKFPTTCPSCEHSPLETDLCIPNKSLRNTMRVWLQKQKKKEEAKAVSSQAATPVVEATPAASEVAADAADRPVESIENVSRAGDVPETQAVAAEENAGEANQRAGSLASQSKEASGSLQHDEAQRQGSHVSQDVKQTVEPTSPAEGPNNIQDPDGSGDGMFGHSQMMNTNGMPGNFGYGFNPNQGSFNAVGFNGMGPMNGMPNMMASGWNMNPIDYNVNNMNGMPGMPNGMYGGFSGNMGMGMNDMSPMMNYGGGYGSGWNGMGSAGYGNFNGYNQMGGYNQSGPYPEMMNQFPKNNFPNRFHANGGAFPPHRNNRNGSFGSLGHGPGFQHNRNSRPGSRSGPPHNRDGESPDGTANAAAETKVKDEQTKASAEPADEGKDDTTSPHEPTSPTAQAADSSSGDAPKESEDLTKSAGTDANEMSQAGSLNQIQTVDSFENEAQNLDQTMMNSGMQPGMQYPAQMMDQFPHQPSHMNGQYNQNMGYNHNSFGHRGSFSTAYGAATVLTGEPRGVGVEGAPTGPRAMREGRPNTGFSSRAINARHNAPPPSVTPIQQTAPASPPRRVRSQSPVRDDSLRTRDRSPSRSRSRSRSRDRDGARTARERSGSVDREEKRQDRGHSPTPKDEAEYEHERRKERRHHRSSRYDDRGERDEREGYDDRYRDDRDDRARSASADSKYRSRRDKEKHRSSRSHRDRSREHRRRHRSRSRSPITEEKYDDEESYANGTDESGSRRKSRGDKDKYRERDRDRSRDRDRDRDRDRRERKERNHDQDYDYEREKDRSHKKDRERRRRQEREAEEHNQEHNEKYRSSRRSRKDRDRDREQHRDRDSDGDYDKEPPAATSTRPVSPPLNAPTGPSADNFSIRGVSRVQKVTKVMPPPQPPTGPRAFQPPKGPAADRDKEHKDHRRKGSMSSSIPSTPTTPAAQDHYAAEREKNARERDRLDRDNRDTLVKNFHTRGVSHQTSRPSLSGKRSRDEFEPSATSTSREPDVKGAPTAPAAHRDKRRKDGGDGDDLASKLTQGLRKRAGAPRRGGIKTEGDAERELERVERERDGRRW